MEERRQVEYAEDEIDLGRYFAILKSHWWKIVGLSLGVGLLTLGYLLTIPNQYKASATITPSIEEARQNPALGAIASLGFQAGGPSKVEDLETLFRSNDLTVRIFQKRNIWPIVYPDSYDPRTGTISSGWKERLLKGKVEGKQPGEWDAIRAAKSRMTIVSNRKMGSLTISFESQSPQGSADIVEWYLEGARNRLQEEALERANKNKKFIEEQIGKTVDALTRERLYGLYGQEVEREMLARNREQLGFRVIDSPRVPDRKAGPRRLRVSALMGLLSFFAWTALYLVR